MVVDDNFEAVVVTGSVLAERARAPHEPAAAVAQLAVERLDNPCAEFAHDVGLGRQHARVVQLGAGEAARVAAVLLEEVGEAFHLVAVGVKVAVERVCCAPAALAGHDDGRVRLGNDGHQRFGVVDFVGLHGAHGQPHQ